MAARGGRRTNPPCANRGVTAVDRHSHSTGMTIDARFALALVALSAACVIDDGDAGADTSDDTTSSDAESGGNDTADGADSTDGDPTGDAPTDGCAAPNGPGTDVPGTIDADVTWTAEGSPYRIAATTYLTATITLEPCTVVQLASDGRIAIGNDPAPGAVVANGEVITDDAGEPLRRAVRFERQDPNAAWGSLIVDATGTLDATTTDFVGGGSTNAGATIEAWGVSPEGTTTPNVRVNDVSIVDSSTHGVYLRRRAAFMPGSDGLRITGTAEGGFPVQLEAGAVHSLPINLEFTDNADDVVLVETFTSVDDDTFVARGVPLRIDDALYLGTADAVDVSTLTIEAGTELEFVNTGAGSGIFVGLDDEHPGMIVAAGEPDAPIILRSGADAPAPGDWMGLYFRYSPAQGNVLSNVTIAHAGAQSGAQGWGCGPADNNASILLLTDPMGPFLSNVTFTECGGDTQIVIGWLDETPAATAAAWAAGNEFAAAPACTVGLPRDTNNGCPGNSEPDCL